MSVPLKPEPISNPFVAGMLIMALASSASSLSNTGAPSPGGQLRMTHSTTPPTEFPSERTSLMRSIISSAAAGSPVRTMLDSMVSEVTEWGSTFALMSWMDLTQARISISGQMEWMTFLATAAAATLPMVSLADALPPPCHALNPNLAS